MMQQQAQEGDQINNTNSQLSISDTTTIAISAMQQLMQSFSYQLQVRSLIKYIPQYNTSKLYKLNKQCVAYFYLQGESKLITLSNNIQQDMMPLNIPKDKLVAFSKSQQITLGEQSKIQIQQNFNNNNNTNINNDSLTFPINITNNSLNYSASKSQYNDNQISGLDEFNNIKSIQSLQIINLNSEFKQQHSTQHINKPQYNQTRHQSSLSSSLIQAKTLNQLIPLVDNTKAKLILQQSEQLQLELQLQHVKKNLYQMRRYRKISIQEERINIQKLINSHKHSHLFINNKSSHTYDYDGGVINSNNNKNNKNNNNNNNNTFNGITQLLTSLLMKNNNNKQSNNRYSLNKKHNHNNNNNKQLDLSIKQINDSLLQNNPQRNLTSQQKSQKVSFNNGNKRQVSHLPFILMKDNAKIIQNKKQLSGSFTQRTSLNRSKLSSMSNIGDNNNNSQNNIKFRSFSQIELQKRQQRSKQKVLDMNQSLSSDLLNNIDILPPTLLNLNNNISQPYKKQSKMMQKYLKKLTEQKSKIQRMIEKDNNGFKNLNFQQINVPQKYPIQRYYEYDYQGEKRMQEYSITSKLSTKRNSLSVVNQTQPNCY